MLRHQPPLLLGDEFELCFSFDFPVQIRSCREFYERCHSRADGLYTIDVHEPNTAHVTKVYCDMTRDGGGWTLLVTSATNKDWTVDNVKKRCVNHFTPKCDQFQISLAASTEILHHRVRRTWLFIAYSDETLYHQFSVPHSMHCSLKGWENVRFELGSERTNAFIVNTGLSRLQERVGAFLVQGLLDPERGRCHQVYSSGLVPLSTGGW